MKKRVLAVILAMVCVLASAIGVSAANSPTGNVTVTESQKGYYQVRKGADEFHNDMTGVDYAATPAIEKYNASGKIEDLAIADATVLEALKGKTDLTKVFDLHDVNGGNKVGGLHKVTLHVPQLTEQCKEVVVLHFEEKAAGQGYWEILKDSTFDTKAKTVTVVSDHLSPIAIFATVDTSAGTGTSYPMAGTSSTWMLFAAAALVVVGSGVVVARKRK